MRSKQSQNDLLVIWMRNIIFIHRQTFLANEMILKQANSSTECNWMLQIVINAKPTKTDTKNISNLKFKSSEMNLLLVKWMEKDYRAKPNENLSFSCALNTNVRISFNSYSALDWN